MRNTLCLLVVGLIVAGTNVATAQHDLPFDGSSNSGVVVTDAKSSGLSDNDKITMVAKTNHNDISIVVSPQDLLDKCSSRMNGSDEVAVYLQNEKEWRTITLIAATPANGLPFKVDRVVGGLRVRDNTHPELKDGDIIRKISVPDNLGFFSNQNVDSVTTERELLDALDRRKNGSNRVAIYYERPNGLPGFAHLIWP